MNGFVRLNSVDHIWHNMDDSRSPEEFAQDTLDDHVIWARSRKAMLRCLHCGKTNRSVFTHKRCACGNNMIYISRAMKRSAEALHNAGFILRGATDVVRVDKSTNDALSMVFVDFDGVYDKQCFFCESVSLGSEWDCIIIVDDDGNKFTRLFSYDIVTMEAGDEAEKNVKRLALYLESWAREAEASSYAAVCTLADYGAFWRIPGG